MNKKELDNFITTDWREEQEEIENNCMFYEEKQDLCSFPYKGLFGNGCLGRACRFWKGKKNGK